MPVRDLAIGSPEHTPAILRMAQCFHQYSPYANDAYDPEKVSEFISGVFSGSHKQSIVILSMAGADPVGMISGLASETFFNREKVATELVWWLDPEYRVGSRGQDLEDAFVYWAKNIAGCSRVAMVALEDKYSAILGRHYTRQGYRKTENTYVKDL